MHSSAKQTGEIHILDIRSNDTSANASITEEIARGLDAPVNLKTLPEYYPFGAEEEILRKHAYHIVQLMHGRTNGVVHGEVIVELGAG